jgi:hypothetical protein
MAVEQAGALVTHEAQEHGAGMPVNAAGKWVLGGVASPGGLLLFRDGLFPTRSISPWYAAEEASIIIKALEADALQPALRLSAAPDARRSPSGKCIAFKYTTGTILIDYPVEPRSERSIR